MTHALLEECKGKVLKENAWQEFSEATPWGKHPFRRMRLVFALGYGALSLGVLGFKG
jgi:hypothetical protein